MNNYEITKYLDQHNKKHTITSVTKYVEDINKSKNDFLFGIFVKKQINIFMLEILNLAELTIFIKLV